MKEININLLPLTNLMKFEKFGLDRNLKIDKNWHIYYWKDREKIKNELNELLPRNDNKSNPNQTDLLNDQPLLDPKFWDLFYKRNKAKFFKDRNWYEVELPELFYSKASETKISLLEVGCGVGNSIFPISAGTTHLPNLTLWALDYSKDAIMALMKDIRYKQDSRIMPFIYDLTSGIELDTYGIKQNSIDIILLVFVLSAIERKRMDNAIEKLTKILKPGGIIIFRDYAKFDIVQLRFKKNNWISENQYKRGDGTLIYFFSLNELLKIFPRSKFFHEELDYYPKLVLNHKRNLAMNRIWVKGRFILKK